MFNLKLGIFGGTFNPIHNGHINIASNVYKYLSLDKVLFMPNKIPPHKNIECILNDKIRVEMIKIAINDYDFMGIEDYEIKKDGISYTYQSLEYLDRIYKGDELFSVIGSDSFINFDKWQKINRIFRSANLVVYLRDNSHKYIINDIKVRYEKTYKGKIFLLLGDVMHISSTEVRENIFNGKDIGHLVPKPLYEYIVSKKLYVG